MGQGIIGRLSEVCARALVVRGINWRFEPQSNQPLGALQRPRRSQTRCTSASSTACDSHLPRPSAACAAATSWSSTSSGSPWRPISLSPSGTTLRSRCSKTISSLARSLVVLLVRSRRDQRAGSGCTTAAGALPASRSLNGSSLAVVAGSAVAMAVVYGAAFLLATDRRGCFPRSFWIAELLVTLAVLGGVRFAIRAASDGRPTAAQTAGGTQRRPTLLYGAGRTGASMAASAVAQARGRRPAGRLPRRRSASGRCGWSATCASSAASTRSTAPIAATGAEALAHHDAGRSRDAASGRSSTRPSSAAWTSAPCRRMSDLLDGTLDAYRVRRVQVEDLLRRTDRDASMPPPSTRSSATGSCSSPAPVARSARSWRARSSRSGPRRLILVDRAESAALPRPARARGRRVRGQGMRRAAGAPRQRRQPRRDGSPDRDRATRRHLPRRRLQARADDGGASRPTPST